MLQEVDANLVVVNIQNTFLRILYNVRNAHASDTIYSIIQYELLYKASAVSLTLPNIRQFPLPESQSSFRVAGTSEKKKVTH